jgi:uncharacterized protein involved in exopolysaccharide biosynthesis
MTSNELNIEKIFQILRTRIQLVIGVFLGCVLVAAIITFQLPKMYQATATLNFDFSSSNPIDSRGRSVLSEESYLTTQVGILQSLNVAQQVVSGLSDYQRDRVIAALEESHSKIDELTYSVKRFVKSLFTASDAGSEDDVIDEQGGSTGSRESLPSQSPYDWLARAIRYDLVVTPQVNSRIVEVAFYSTDPQVAALIADRFADAYIATNLQMIIDPARKSKVWFDEQLKSLRLRLEEAQATLTAYQQREGIVSSDQRIDIESTKLRNLSEQLTAALQAKRNAESEKQKLNEVLERGESLVTFEPVFNNPVVQKIKAEMRDFEARLVESSNSLGANHPRIKRLKSELAASQARLNQEIRTITDGIKNGVDLSRERVNVLEAAVEKQKQLVLNLKNEHDKIAVYQRDVDSAQTSYNAALNELNTTSLQSMVDQTSVSVVDHASIPSIHASPRLSMNLALGAFGGLLLGIGIALFLEIFVRRVYSEDDIVSEMGIPLLGHLRKF